MFRNCFRSGVAVVLTFCVAQASFGALTGQYLLESDGNDSSGNNRHGTLTGNSGTPDFVGGLYSGSTGALRLNYNAATGQYDKAQIHRVQLPGDTAFIRNAPAATLMAWVQLEGTIGGTQSIVGVSESTGGTRAILQFQSNGNVRMLGRRVDGGNNANYVSNGATPFAAVSGEKYFIVGIMDYVNADIRVYINGVQHTGGTFQGLTNLGTAGPTNVSVDMNNFSAFIGTNTAGTGEQLAGIVDGVRIFDHALTNDEILAIYNAEVPEPASLGLLLVGGLALMRNRRRA